MGGNTRLRWPRPGRWAIVAGVICIGVGAIAFSAAGLFTGSAARNQAVTGGTMTLNLADGAGNALSVAATGIAPDDVIQRTVNVTTGGNVSMSAITLTTSAACGGCASSVFDTDAVNGLQLNIDKCSVAWTQGDASTPYSCSGASSVVLASRAVIGSSLALGNINVGGATNRLLITLTLPNTADDTFQSASSTIEFRFNGTQRSRVYS